MEDSPTHPPLSGMRACLRGEDDRVDLGELLGQISGFALSFFPFQKIDQIDGVVKAHALAVMDGGDTERDGKMGFAGAGSANRDQIVRRFQIVPLGQLLDAGTVQACFAQIKTRQIAVDGETCSF